MARAESGAALARFTCAPVTRCQPFRCTVARISSRNGAQQMSYTLGQAAKAVGMSKTSILRSIKAGRISAGRDEFGQWSIEPCELHRVYSPMADDTGTGMEERGVTGGETAVAEATTRASLAEARLSDFKSMLDDIREQRGDAHGRASTNSGDQGAAPSDAARNKVGRKDRTCEAHKFFAEPALKTPSRIIAAVDSGL